MPPPSSQAFDHPDPIANKPIAPRFRGAADARLRAISRRLDAGDDGRLNRARHQLVDDVREIPLAGARRVRSDLALAAVPVVLSACRRACRPLRSAPHYPGRHVAVRALLTRM